MRLGGDSVSINGLGTRVREKRLSLKMSQEELALKVGYTSRSSINKIELGLVDVPQSKIVALADALQTSIYYLMGSESMQQKNDTIADVVLRLRTDDEFFNVVDRLATDDVAFAFVDAALSLDDVKLNSLIVMTDALKK